MPAAKVAIMNTGRKNQAMNSIAPRRVVRVIIMSPITITIDLMINPTMRMREFITKAEKSSSKPRFLCTSPILLHFENRVLARRWIEKKL